MVVCKLYTLSSAAKQCIIVCYRKLKIGWAVPVGWGESGWIYSTSGHEGFDSRIFLWFCLVAGLVDIYLRRGMLTWMGWALVDCWDVIAHD